MSRLPAVAIALLFGCKTPSGNPVTAAGSSDVGRGMYEEAGAIADAGPPDVPVIPVAWALALKPLRVRNVNHDREGMVRLYRDDGQIDLSAATVLRDILGKDSAAPIEERTMQLLVKAAYHFEGAAITIISSYRPGRHNGPHGDGYAVDFQLAGVPARKLASYLRSLPKVGVGIYTHPKTQFAHLDIRETSYHWLDASPPGVEWRVKRLADPHQEERDATYDEESDLPL